MKPKTRHIVAALLFTAAASFGQLSSPWNFTQDVARAESQQTPMQWFAAETLELNLWSRRLSSAVDFSDPGLKLLWEVVAQTNVQTTWAATTGTVTAATNGAARYSLNNQQANLPAGSYLGFVRAVWTNGTITSNVVLQYQAITVKASGNSALYPVADPITQAYGITGAYVNVGGSVTQSGRTLYFNTPGVFTSLVRGAGSSDRLTVTNGGGPQATISLNVSGLATGSPVYSLAGYATGTPVYAESDPIYLAGTGAIWAAISSKATGSPVYAITHVSEGSGNAVTQVVAGGSVVTSRYGTISASGGGSITSIVRGAGSSTRLSVSNGAGPIVTLNLDVSGLATGTPVYSLSGYATGTPVYAETDPRWQAGTGAIWSAISSKATGTPVYAESDPVWVGASNLYYTKVLADAKFATGTPVYVESDTAAIAQVGAASNALNAGVIAVGVTASNLAASSVKYQDTRGFTNTGGARFSGAITADGGLSSTGSIRITNGDESNTISNTGIVLEGGGANPFRIANQIAQVSGTTVLNFGERRGYGSWTLGGEGAGELSGSVTIYASNLVWWNTSLFETGKLNAATLVGVDGSGLTNLPSSGGGAQSPATNIIDLAGNQITNGAARLNSLRVGPNVSDSGTNNVALTGWSTFGAGSHHNVAIGGGITFQFTKEASLASGSNIVMGASWAAGLGKDLQLLANYDFVAGCGNSILSAGQASTIAGGYLNTNEGALYATIGGGTRNAQGSGALYSYITGGASNRVEAIGGGAIGHSGYVPSTATNGLIINVGRALETNALPHGITIVAPGTVVVKVGSMTFTVGTGTVSAAVGTGSFSFAESGLIVNGVLK